MKKLLGVLLSTMVLLSVLIPLQPTQIQAIALEDVVITIDDADKGSGLNQFEFKGTWYPATGVASDYNGTEHWTNKSRWGATPPSATIRFRGNAIEVFGKKDKDLGIYKVVLDGDEENAFEADAYNVTPQSKESLFKLTGLSEGEHEITIYVQNKINAMAAVGVNIGAQLDYAVVDARQPVDVNKIYKTYINDHTMGDDLFQFSFSNGWSTSTGYPQYFYNGDEHWSAATATSNPSFKVQFIGSKIELYGKKEASGAKYSVRIDGKDEVIVDSYNPTAAQQQLLYAKEGLEEGNHTLELKVLYEKNPANTTGRYTAQIDYAIAYHKAIEATDLKLDKTGLTIEEGMDDAIVATAIPAYATNPKFIYSVDDPTIAKVEQDGTVTALKAGATTIKVELANGVANKVIPITVSPENGIVALSVADENRLETQDQYANVLLDNKATFDGSAWRGDVINSKINMVTKSKAIHNAQIKVSDFTSENNVIKSSNVETYWLKETKANIGRGSAVAPVKDFPDIMHTDEKVDVNAKKLQSAWININVPKDAKPGVYTGEVEIIADEFKEPYKLAYTFEVIDLLQPTTDDTKTTVQIWQHPFAVAQYYGVTKAEYFTEKHLNYMRASMQEYKEMGGRDVVANIVEDAWNNQSYSKDPSMVSWRKKVDGTFDFDYTLFDRWVQFNIEEGVLDPEKGLGQIKCYSIVPWNNQVAYFDEASSAIKKVSAATGSAEWKALWVPFLESFVSHVETKGWFDITYIAMDERDIDDLKKSASLIETVTNKEGKSLKISSAMNYQSANDFAFTDRIHDVSIGLSHISQTNTIFKDLVEHRNEKGLVTTVYTCTGDYPSNFTISDPADNAWTMWYSMSQGATGYMRWAWDNWVDDPLTNVSYRYWEPGDGWYIYPTEKGQVSDTYFYKTPRYELFKQGVRDVNKAKFLQQQSQQMEEKVDTLVGSLKRPNKTTAYGSAVPRSEADRELVFAEVSRMREGINTLAKEYVDSLVIEVEKIDVDKTKVALEEEQSVIINAVAKPDNATNKQLTWSSKNDEVATVKDGVITAVAKGETIVTVSDASNTIHVDIEVTVSAKEVEEPGNKPEENPGNKPEENPGNKPEENPGGSGNKPTEKPGNKPTVKPGNRPTLTPPSSGTIIDTTLRNTIAAENKTNTPAVKKEEKEVSKESKVEKRTTTSKNEKVEAKATPLAQKDNNSNMPLYIIGGVAIAGIAAFALLKLKNAKE